MSSLLALYVVSHSYYFNISNKETHFYSVSFWAFCSFIYMHYVIYNSVKNMRWNVFDQTAPCQISFFICWDHFIHIMSVKVNDELRVCSYCNTFRRLKVKRHFESEFYRWSGMLFQNGVWKGFFWTQFDMSNERHFGSFSIWRKSIVHRLKRENKVRVEWLYGEENNLAFADQICLGEIELF